ncbi:MAG: hypothetical protein QOD83_4791 [Solirubrobacteraceae bacterium]|nr:hypothetical protein [Solirubrobacteraceae bacterium]MEA2182231.1 hypothetical protein [Solirubrobacteraceae bacterium]MEA2188079.1 hypothetical protein [Solirubrobacteraceae bacterium]MEA2234975.1 hypothetical protein [Solirubrobacteraceae bacterium]
MNTGIEVYFTQVNAPWSNDETDFFRVNVFNPTGAERIGVPAPNGRASIDLPPGRYLVTATKGGFYVNYDSNETIVNVGCDQRVCVTIIPRSLHYCVWWLSLALKAIARDKKAAPEVAPHAEETIAMLDRIADVIPEELQIPEVRRFDIDTLEKQLREDDRPNR